LIKEIETHFIKKSTLILTILGYTAFAIKIIYFINIENISFDYRIVLRFFIFILTPLTLIYLPTKSLKDKIKIKNKLIIFVCSFLVIVFLVSYIFSYFQLYFELFIKDYSITILSVSSMIGSSAAARAIVILLNSEIKDLD